MERNEIDNRMPVTAFMSNHMTENQSVKISVGTFLSVKEKVLKSGQPVLFEKSFLPLSSDLQMENGVVSVRRRGIYLIQFGLIPARGAQKGDEMFACLGRGLRLDASRRALANNGLPTECCLFSGLSEGEVFFLSVAAHHPIFLAETPPTPNAWLTLARLCEWPYPDPVEPLFPIT